MKNILQNVFLLFIFIQLIYPVKSYPQYVRYKNNRFNYSIIIPKEWSRANLNLKNKHIMYVTKNINTDIKIKAYKSTKKDLVTSRTDGSSSTNNIFSLPCRSK